MKRKYKLSFTIETLHDHQITIQACNPEDADFLEKHFASKPIPCPSLVVLDEFEGES
jgi:hypothetical protein